MKNFFTNRNYITVIITVLFVAFLGAVYFFIYIPNNEKRLQAQRFRTLQNINKNIHEKIKNSAALMNNLLKPGVDVAYINYLSNQSKANFTLTLPQMTGKDFKMSAGITDSGYLVKTINENRELVLQYYKLVINANHDTTARYEMGMKFNFDQFFKTLLPEYVFDNYVVFNHGFPVYETLPFGNDLRDTIFGKDNKIQASPVRKYNISGVDYKLFLQPVSYLAGNDWAIAGLLSDKRYQQEKNQLPSNMILLLVTIVLAIMVSFPWIKLYQMGSKDRLTLADGIASVAVSMLLMSILFFSFFKYNVLLRPNDHTDSKLVLAKQIARAFQNDIDSVYDKLHFVDALMAGRKNVFFRDMVKDSLPAVVVNDDSVQRLSKIRSDTNIRQIFWMDKDGDEVVNWTSEQQNAPHGNFKDRAYFKNIVQHKPYWTDTGKVFYLDQVISWTSGNFTSVLSIPSKVSGQQVAAVSFNMQSVNTPVLPPGYQFAIINNKGKVLYHSEASRNLNEDLLNEFSQKEKLLSALEARTEDGFKTSYFSKDYNVYVKPVRQLPYFIVIFSDLSYKATREMEIYSFTFSMLLLLFLFFILQLFTLFLVSSRRSFFKKQTFDTSWIGPKEGSHHEYNLSIMVNLFIMYAVIVFFPVSSFLSFVFMLLFSVTFGSIFLNSVFARRYYRRMQHDNYRYKIASRNWLVVLLVLIELGAFKILDTPSMLWLLLFETVICIAGIFFYYQGSKILGAVKLRINKIFLERWKYQQSFALMALTRLIITSGIPVAFFYISAYNYEQNISIRYRQLNYAHQLLSKLDSSGGIKISANKALYKGYYTDSVWVKDIYIDHKGPALLRSEEDSITSKILDLFRLGITDLAVREDRFSSAHAADTSIAFNPLLKDACKKDSATITYVKLKAPGTYLAIKSAGLNYKLPLAASWPLRKALLYGLAFWLMLLVALLVFYFIVYNIISKLFCLNLPDLSLCSEVDTKIIRNQDTNNLLFVIGLPGSGKLKRILKEVENGGIKANDGPLKYHENNAVAGNVVVADLINIPDMGDEKSRNEVWQKFATKHIFNDKNRLIIVNHFEYNIQDTITNRIKLNFLEQLMLDNKCKIIILSTIHPVAFLDSVMDAESSQKQKPDEDLERWHVLLGHYRIVIYPLCVKPVPHNAEFKFKALYKETEYTHFLNNIQGTVLDVAKEQEKKLHNNADELIFKLQVTAHYFYMYIWQSLTKEEKFLMYDLAEDNLVNGYDDYNLNMLLAKGVIVRRNGTLTLFNRGFRNFILTAIGNTEAIKIKNRIRDNGNWGRLKTPLIIVIIAILTFLLASQKEAYSEMMAYIAALGAGIPALLKIFSLFDKTEQKA